MLEKVSIGQYLVMEKDGILAAYGLGSCVGLFLYDPSAKVGGLAHIMLPGRKPENLPVNPSRYAENAVDSLIEEMTARGASVHRIGAIPVGASSMFREAYGGDDRQTIGQKNQEAILEILKRRVLSVVAQDLGGEIGRTMEASVRTGNVLVKTLRSEIKELKWR